MNTDRQKQSTRHAVIMKDLGHITKKQGMMVTVKCAVKKITYCHIVSLSVSVWTHNK